MTFGDLLRKLIEQSGKSISSVSKDAEIERTSLHKAMTGERTLPYPAVKKLAAYLRLSPHEQKVFFEYYDMQVQGPHCFASRKTIVHILKEISSLPFPDKKQNLVLLMNHSENAKTEDKPQLLSGLYAVRNRLRRMIDLELQEKDPELFLFLPVDDGFTMYYLYNVLSEYETDLKVTHIIPYRVENETRDNDSLEILERILPLTLMIPMQYHSYFYYNKYEAVATPFPYYLITSSGILMVSENYETACQISSGEMVFYYQSFFRQTTEKCTPLLHVQKDIFTILRTYADTVEKNSFYTFMRQPCMGKFYTMQLIEKKVKKDLPFREQLVRESQKRFSDLAQVTGNYYTFFTRDGLQEFLLNGIIYDIPQQVIDALSVEERLVLVKGLRDAVADDSVTGRIVNDERLTLPRYLSFCVNAKNKVDIFTLQRHENDEQFYNIHIDEPLLGRKFMDFVLFLPKSEYVLDKEETLRIIDDLLEKAEH